MQGRTALITGAAGAVGSAVARQLSVRGATLVLADKARTPLNHFAASLAAAGASVLAMETDVASEQSVERLIEAGADRFGRIDMVFNNAGIEGVGAPISDYPAAAFDEVLSVNLRGVFLVLKHAIRHMQAKGGGSIVNSGSTSGVIGNPNACAYVASKHAVVGLTRAAAAEGGAMGIRVNCVAAGPLESPLMERFEMAQPSNAATVRNWYETQTPLGRYGDPEEIASLVTFLLSDDASFLSGAVYLADGGLTGVGRTARPAVRSE